MLEVEKVEVDAEGGGGSEISFKAHLKNKSNSNFMP